MNHNPDRSRVQDQSGPFATQETTEQSPPNRNITEYRLSDDLLGWVVRAKKAVLAAIIMGRTREE